jgi:hypothetical protein
MGMPEIVKSNSRYPGHLQNLATEHNTRISRYASILTSVYWQAYRVVV